MCYLANRVPKRDSKCKDPEAEVYLAYSNKPPENLVRWLEQRGEYGRRWCREVMAMGASHVALQTIVRTLNEK